MAEPRSVDTNAELLKSGVFDVKTNCNARSLQNA